MLSPSNHIAQKAADFHISGLKSFIGNIFIASKKVKLISVTAFAGAAVNIICNFVLIKFLGPVGAALATMLGYIVTFLTRCVMLRKTAKLKVNVFVVTLSYCLLIVQSVIATKGDMLWLQILLFVVLLLIQFKCIGSFLGLAKEKFFKKNECKE